ncbi:MAG TPA: hypothetical protein VIM11_01160 [Tepidisphaeraceae bacterium]|jgi:hypothetical protein
MHVSTRRLPRHSSTLTRAAVRQACRVEPLEGRTLLSTTWGTFSDLPLTNLPGFTFNKMTVDPSGNVYVVGTYTGASSWGRGIALEKAAGSSTWTTILDLGISTATTEFQAVTANALGDVYIAGRNGATAHHTIWERSAGQSNFAVVDDFAAGRYFGDLTIDAAGNVFAVGSEIYPTKNSPFTTHWIVRKRVNGQGPFTNVDDTGEGTTARAITIVGGSGSNAGIYVVGQTNNTATATAIVRKSTNGGVSWTDVDHFLFDPATSGGCVPLAMTTDSAGDVFVVGGGFKGTLTGGNKTHPTYSYAENWLVRETTDGGATWTLRDSTVPGEARAAGYNPVTGTVYVAGWASETDSTTGLLRQHSLIRSNLGGTFATEDDFQLVPGKYASADGFGVDASGNLFVGILADDSTGPHLLLRTPTSTLTPAAATFSAVTIASASASSPAVSAATEFFSPAQVTSEAGPHHGRLRQPRLQILA